MIGKLTANKERCMETQITQKDKIEAITWNEYPVLGLLVALMLVILNFSDKVYYLTIPAVLFFFVTGLRENCKILIHIIKKYFPILIIEVAAAGYYQFVAKAAGSGSYFATMTVLIIAGCCLTMWHNDNLESIYDKLWVFLLALLILGIVKNVADKTIGYFMTAEAEMTAAVIFVTITLLFIDDLKFKIVGVLVSGISGFLQFKNGAVGIQKTISHLYDSFPTTILHNYKSMILVMGAILGIYGILVFIKTDKMLMKKQAVLMCVTLAASVVEAAGFQLNVLYILYTIIGISLGIYIDY